MQRSSTANSRTARTAEDAIITSRDNRWLKQFRASLAGEHAKDGLIGVEGARLVEAALASPLTVEALLVSQSGKRHLERLAPQLAGLRVLHTSNRLFAGVTDTQAPQGIAALVRPKTVAVKDLVRGTALVVALVAVQDPGNVGTILRAAEAFGATGAATCSVGELGSANPLAPKALRASAGAALRLPILRGISPTILFSQLRVLGVKIYATAPDADSAEHRERTANPTLRPWEADWKSPTAVIIGNEGAGLPEEILRAADARVSIPQSAAAAQYGLESLNAAMAATILLYEAMRQRGAHATTTLT